MSTINYYVTPELNYPVFEPDQVLTDKHLNEAFTHLQRQEQLTRNRLIGMGIVSGLQATWVGNNIIITAGCGLTSLGYLANFSGGTYSHLRTYVVPDFPETIDPAIKADYVAKTAYLLVPVNQTAEGDIPITDKLAELDDLVVTLFTEPYASDLKNCTTDDCTDKGQQVNITVRPLLVKSAGLQPNKELISQQDTPICPELHLKRWNVPARNIQHPSNVIETFDEVLDAKLKDELTAAFTFVYNSFNPLFSIADDDKLKTVGTQINSLQTDVRTKTPLYYQYIYDYVNDLVNAYQDFCEVVFDVTSKYNADELQFPLHLALGHTVLPSAVNKKNYRHYFVNAPLFAQDKCRYQEACVLYTRIVKMLTQFKLPDTQKEIRITPSYLGQGPLGRRCIPFYYNALDLYPYWDFEKSRKGRAKMNRSYFASKYSTDLATTNPLAYDMDAYNFFRVEGHIGQPVKDVVKALNTARELSQVDFDVLSLNLYATSTLPQAGQLSAHFGDIDSQYDAMLNELLGRVRNLYNTIAQTSYDPATNPISGMNFAPVNSGSNILLPGGGSEAWPNTAALFIKKVRDLEDYNKGAFLQFFCGASQSQATVGGYYLRWLALPANQGKLIATPAAFDFLTTPKGTWDNLSFQHYFYMIDVLEELLVRLIPFALSAVILSSFKDQYNKLITAITKFAEFFDAWKHAVDIIADQVANADNTLIKEEREYYQDVEKAVVPMMADCRSLLQICVDERLNQLRLAYAQRCEYVLEQHIFSHYTKLHPGVQHKSGVTKGGTLLLLYFDKTDISGAPGPADDTINKLIPQGVVCADMFIPGIHTASYAPVAEIYEGAPDNTPIPELFLAVRNFCNNDAASYAVVTTPKGGELKGPVGAITKDSNDNYSFKPLNVPEGDYALEYAMGGKSVFLAITVKAALNPVFSYTKETNADGTGVIVRLTAGTQTGQHIWDFGNGTGSTQANPVVTYLLQPGETRNFTISHTVSNGNACTLAPSKQTVTVDRPLALSLTMPTDLCTNAGLTRIYYTPDGGTMTCDPKPGAISKVNGLFYFNPAVAGPGKFTITYKINDSNFKSVSVTVRQASSAGFTYSLKEIPNNSMLFAREAFAGEKLTVDRGTYRTFDVSVKADVAEGSHEWTLSDGQRAIGTTATFRFKIYEGDVVNVVRGGVSFTVSHKITRDACSAVETYVIWSDGGGEASM